MGFAFSLGACSALSLPLPKEISVREQKNSSEEENAGQMFEY